MDHTKGGSHLRQPGSQGEKGLVTAVLADDEGVTVYGHLLFGTFWNLVDYYAIG